MIFLALIALVNSYPSEVQLRLNSKGNVCITWVPVTST